MRRKAVADATPLIHLAKIDRLEILPRFYAVVVVPATVQRETLVSARQRGLPEALVLKRAFRDGVLQRSRDPAIPADVPSTLGAGERAAIALALREKSDLLVDDHDAYIVARALGLRARRTTSLLLEGISRGFWDPRWFETELRRLVAAGFHLTADLYMELVDHARRLQRR